MSPLTNGRRQAGAWHAHARRWGISSTAHSAAGPSKVAESTVMAAAAAAATAGCDEELAGCWPTAGKA
eukprot:15410435-Alexandrium_andersonii.AAC.1